MINETGFVCKKLNIDLNVSLMEKMKYDIPDDLIKFLQNNQIRFTPSLKYDSLEKFDWMIKTLYKAIAKYGNINVSLITSAFSNINTIYNIKDSLKFSQKYFKGTQLEKQWEQLLKYARLMCSYSRSSNLEETSRFLLNLNPTYYKANYEYNLSSEYFVVFMLQQLNYTVKKDFIQEFIVTNIQSPISIVDFANVVNIIGLNNYSKMNNTFKSHPNSKVLQYFNKLNPNYIYNYKIDSIPEMLKVKGERTTLPLQQLLVFLTPEQLLSANTLNIEKNIKLTSIKTFLGTADENDINIFATKFMQTNNYDDLPNMSYYKVMPLKLSVTLQLIFLLRRLGIQLNDPNLVKYIKTLKQIFVEVISTLNLPFTTCFNCLANMNLDQITTFINKVSYMKNNGIPLDNAFNNIKDITPYNLEVQLELAVDYLDKIITYINFKKSCKNRKPMTEEEAREVLDALMYDHV